MRTGGKNDPADNTGMAHYLEHMLFKGTTQLGTTDWSAERPLQEEIEGLYERLGAAGKDERKQIAKRIGETVKQTYAYAVPNELDQLLEQIGGTGVNAFTTWDETVYHNTFPASQLDAWLKIYAHRFVDPVFRLFPTELEAVYEEKNIAIDTTGYELFRRMMKGVFPEHGYSQDILGEVEHLKRPSLKAMKRYFERYYVPQNMALVLSGDFDSGEALIAIEEHFGAWKAGPDPKAPAYKVEPFDPDERLSVRLSPVRVGAIAFRTVPERHPDYAALMVARRLLSNEQRSGFIDRISDDGNVLIAFYIPADFADHNVDGVAYVPRILTQTFRGRREADAGAVRPGARRRLRRADARRPQGGADRRSGVAVRGQRRASARDGPRVRRPRELGQLRRLPGPAALADQAGRAARGGDAVRRAPPRAALADGIPEEEAARQAEVPAGQATARRPLVDVSRGAGDEGTAAEDRPGRVGRAGDAARDPARRDAGGQPQSVQRPLSPRAALRCGDRCDPGARRAARLPASDRHEGSPRQEVSGAAVRAEHDAGGRGGARSVHPALARAAAAHGGRALAARGADARPQARAQGAAAAAARDLGVPPLRTQGPRQRGRGAAAVRDVPRQLGVSPPIRPARGSFSRRPAPAGHVAACAALRGGRALRRQRASAGHRAGGAAAAGLRRVAAGRRAARGVSAQAARRDDDLLSSRDATPCRRGCGLPCRGRG